MNCDKNTQADKKDGLWAIVLAGEVGRGLMGVTENGYKGLHAERYRLLGPDPSLLQLTLDRLGPVVESDQTVIVVDESMRSIAYTFLRKHGKVLLLDRAQERGSGSGVILALQHILSRDSDATVLLLPASHHYERPSYFEESVAAARTCVDFDPTRTVLLGAEPSYPASVVLTKLLPI